jgi:hypothetical protein
MNRKRWMVLPISVLLSGFIWTQSETSETPVMAASISTAVLETKPIPYSLHLASVNGISLSDDLKTIYELKGQPTSIEQDEVLKTLRTYYFKDCIIGMSDGAVQNIVVPAAVGSVEIDGQTVPLELNTLKEKLGTPFFISEDGIVYKDGLNVFKIFLNIETGQVSSVSYFHSGVQ